MTISVLRPVNWVNKMRMEASVVIHLYTRKKPLEILGEESFTAEELCVRSARECDVGPVARHLFGLWCDERRLWLCPSETVPGDRKCYLHFKLRFKLPNIERLGDIQDPVAFNYYFHQMRFDFLYGCFPEMTQYRNKALGLAAADMIRAILEKEQTLADMKHCYKDFLPREIWKRHWYWVKRPLLDAVEKGMANSKKNPVYVKAQFMREFYDLIPDYGVEEYLAQMDEGGKIWEVFCQVHPYHAKEPGIRVQLKGCKTWTYVCSIEDLCYVSIRNDGTVEISRRSGIPQYLKFGDLDQMRSFVSALDGYYRLREKWTFNLCRQLATPSLLMLKSLKCHGPIGQEFAYSKLKEKKNCEIGCYVLRESSSYYDRYRLDACLSEGKPTTLEIAIADDGRFFVNGLDRLDLFDSLKETLLFATQTLPLKYCIPPTEYDKTNLLLCRPDSAENHTVFNQSECTSMPHCIPSEAVVFGRDSPMQGRFGPVRLATIRYGREGHSCLVAVKSLHSSLASTRLQDFLQQCNRVLFWKCEALVSTLGLILASPLSLVMEHFPMGPLDSYLRQHSNELKEVDLIESVSYLARALWYLEEEGCCHGKIRCRNVMMFSHTKNTFKVKLADPGLCIYTHEDLPWIPPECHSDLSMASSSLSADVWAFGTTLWEIFSFGQLPDIRHNEHEWNLPSLGCHEEIVKLMQECWVVDPDERKRAQAIMRDVNQTLYEVYNSRRSNLYATVYSEGSATVLDGVVDEEEAPTPPPVTSIPIGGQPHQTGIGARNSFMRSAIRLMKHSNYSYGRMSAYSGSSDRSTFTVLTDSDSVNGVPIGSLVSIYSSDGEMPPDSNGTLLDGEESTSSMSWVIDYSQLTFGQILGEGFYGEVCKATLTCWSGLKTEAVAVKRIKKPVHAETGLSDLLRESNIMKSLRHKNIVEIKGLVEEPQTMLVMEYLELGSLLAHVQMYRNKLSHELLIKFATDIAEGMQYLEEKHIVHRDLAARNILVASRDEVKISDFGLAQFTEDHYYRIRTERNLPIRWYAPESIKFGKFSHKSDVWSYGVTLWEMFSFGQNPVIPGVSDTELAEALERGQRLGCPDDCLLEIYNMMGTCWNGDSHLRPTFSLLLECLREETRLTS